MKKRNRGASPPTVTQVPNILHSWISYKSRHFWSYDGTIGDYRNFLHDFLKDFSNTYAKN